MVNKIPLETYEDRWRNLHRIAGITAFAIAILLLGECYVYSVIPNPSTTIGYMDLFLKNPLFGLLHFDLLGMISYLLFIPFTLSLFMLLKGKNEYVTLIATVLFFIGIAVFFSTNTNFSMLSLSKQYSLAKSDTERLIILTSFQTMVTLFKVQAFMTSYIIVSIAWVMFGCVMLKSILFNKFTSCMGILCGISGIVAEIFENTSKALLGLAIAFYFCAVVFLLIWVVLIGITVCKIIKHTGS
jgi:hypothetical protein